MERKNVSFDPVLIVYQIVCIQAFYYLFMGTLLGIFHTIFDIQVTLDHFFNAEFVTFDTWSGWTIIFCTFLGALGGAYLLSIVVEKSKKCVDFTFTLYFMHILICGFYSGEFPLQWEWWLIMVLSSVVMASLGEYICSKAELEDIPLYNPS
jgi:hypothetical protein